MSHPAEIWQRRPQVHVRFVPKADFDHRCRGANYFRNGPNIRSASAAASSPSTIVNPRSSAVFPGLQIDQACADRVAHHADGDTDGFVELESLKFVLVRTITAAVFSKMCRSLSRITSPSTRTGYAGERPHHQPSE
jgi:hypothetical protein